MSQSVNPNNYSMLQHHSFASPMRGGGRDHLKGNNLIAGSLLGANSGHALMNLSSAAAVPHNQNVNLTSLNNPTHVGLGLGQHSILRRDMSSSPYGHKSKNYQVSKFRSNGV